MGVIAGCRVSGRTGPAVVFVHGVGSTAAIWDEQLRAFGDAYRCFAVELRGNGASQPDPHPHTITREGYVEDVLAVADAVQAERFHYVGCSLGGVVGFELYRRAPGRVMSLTLLGSFAAYPEGAAYAAGIIQSVERAGSMKDFADERVRALGLAAGTRRDETIAQMACKSVPCYEAATNATWTGDYRAVLPQIAVPVLVLHGENDPVAPAHFSQEIADAVPGATLHGIPRAGHVANADNPQAFNALLRDFLRTV